MHLHREPRVLANDVLQGLIDPLVGRLVGRRAEVFASVSHRRSGLLFVEEPLSKWGWQKLGHREFVQDIPFPGQGVEQGDQGQGVTDQRLFFEDRFDLFDRKRGLRDAQLLRIPFDIDHANIESLHRLIEMLQGLLGVAPGRKRTGLAVVGSKCQSDDP